MSTELDVTCKTAAVLNPKSDIVAIIVSYDEGTQDETLAVCAAVCKNLSQYGFSVVRLILDRGFSFKQVWVRGEQCVP